MHYDIPVTRIWLAEFVFKIPWVPKFKYFRNVGLDHLPPPSPPPAPPRPPCRFWQILALWIRIGLDHHPPSSPKMQIWTDLGTLGLRFELIPPRHSPKCKLRQILALWVWVGLDHHQQHHSPPPPPIPKNADLDRSWHFEIMWELVCGD